MRRNRIWFGTSKKKRIQNIVQQVNLLDEQELKNKDQNDEWEYFDDCPICQEMKKADKQGRSLTESELRAAFNKANRKQNNNN